MLFAETSDSKWVVQCMSSIPEEFLSDETFSEAFLAKVVGNLLGTLLFSQSPASVIRPF